MENGTSAAGRDITNSNLLSPPRTVSNQGKERRNPSITPRKFQRFFTPRSRVPSQPSAARRALRDLTAPALNRCQTPSSPLRPLSEANGDDKESLLPPDAARGAKRRKTHHNTPESSPLRPGFLSTTPSRIHEIKPQKGLLSPLESVHPSQESHDVCESEDDDSDASSSGLLPVSRPVPLTQRGYGGQLVQRMAGGIPCAGRRFMSFPVSDWRIETADFCSKPDDVHFCTSLEGAPRCIPFCTTNCNTNGLIAVGDEEGRVRLLDSEATKPVDAEPGNAAGFGKVHISFQMHSNAVIDLAFSEDDSLLASASGDQKGKVIDMMTQIPIAVMGHHTASLKQVRFQPGRGSGSVLATSSRDGSVQVWDLRCKGGRPVQDFVAERESLGFSIPRRVNQGCVVNSIHDAHARTSRQARQHGELGSKDVAWRGEVPGRHSEVSVTAIQFLPPGREHLLLSACEADASIRLWDIRSIHTSRHKPTLPLSYTSSPDSHVQWRPFGISSMSLSTDGARLYALCKDSTVYAYSSSHLILGHAPELSSHGEPPRRKHGTAQDGLGPLYGFRHPEFHATSFYVKSAIRLAQDGRSELLAVGSSNGGAVLFPTDERYFRDVLRSTEGTQGAAGGFTSDATLAASTVSRFRQLTHGVISNNTVNDSITDNIPEQAPAPAGRPRLQRTSTMDKYSARLSDTIPYVRSGTALVRGHEKEVGALTWTHNGRLITVSDDYKIRRWNEDRAAAADLRTGGETGGRRWASGWADIGNDWDEDEW